MDASPISIAPLTPPAPDEGFQVEIRKQGRLRAHAALPGQEAVNGEELAQAEAETEKQADEALRREESVVAERRGAVEGAADEIAALAPKVPRRRPCVAAPAGGGARPRRAPPGPGPGPGPFGPLGPGLGSR